MSLKRFAVLGALLSTGLLAACGDQGPVTPAAPAEQTLTPALSPARVSDLGPSLSYAGSNTVAYQATFTVQPTTKTTVYLGSHVLVFDPSSICRGTSTYGPSEWLKPCTPTAYPTNFTVRLAYTPAGEPLVDFQPARRFNPATNVSLYLRKGTLEAAAFGGSILYVDQTGKLVDEAAADPTLETRDLGPYLQRRIRHFSGYLISSGRTQSMSDEQL